MGRELKNKKIIEVFVFCVLFIPFMGIAGIKNTIDTNIYQAWQILAVSILAFSVLVKAKQIKVNWAIMLFAAYQLLIAMSSILNNGLNFGMLTAITALVLIFVLIQTDCYYDIIFAISIIVVLALIINIPSMINNLDLKDVVFFIGGKNSLGVFLVPGAFFLLIRSQELNGAVTKLAMITALSCIAVVLVGSSGTGIIVAFVTVLFLVISKKFKVKKRIYLGVILAAFAIFILFPENFLFTEYWLRFTDYLGKDISLTSRTHIWKLAKEVVLDNLLFGAGRGTELTYMVSSGEWKTVDEAHNFILEILMEGGAVALALFGALFFKAVKGLDMSKGTHKLVFIAICVILINGLTESTVNNFFVVAMLGVACRFASEQITPKEDQWITELKN